MDEPRTHYQISLTARQAVGLFVGLLLALGVAFFFGLMTGMSGRPRPEGEKPPAPADAESPAAAVSEWQPEARTTATPSAASRTELAGAPSGLEPTAPSTLQSFEDSAAEPFPAPVTANAPTPAARARTADTGSPAPAGKPRRPSGKIWVQVASLTSRAEASALSDRLSKHGFHSLVLTTSGPKGKIHRVRVGPYRSEDEAGKAAARLAKDEKIKQPWVVPEGK